MTYLRTLMDAAALQRGFVTPQNARDLGVPAVELPKLAARGALDHCSYGLYRVAGYPSQLWDELVQAVLWAGGGHISHESALSLWGLADVNPRLINVTVPGRIRRAGGSLYRLWIAELSKGDVDEHVGVPVTAPLRSVTDAAKAGTDPRLVRQALGNVLRLGLASERDVEMVRADLYEITSA
jgi:predicted transcriptional regulator of viral defense system